MVFKGDIPALHYYIKASGTFEFIHSMVMFTYNFSFVFQGWLLNTKVSYL